MECLKSLKDGNYEVAVKGKITFSDHLDFKNIIMSVNDNKCQNMTLDISDVDFIDSVALGMILLLRDETQKNKVDLKIRNPKGQVKKMFQISNFYDLFDIED